MFVKGKTIAPTMYSFEDDMWAVEIDYNNTVGLATCHEGIIEVRFENKEGAEAIADLIIKHLNNKKSIFYIRLKSGCAMKHGDNDA